MTEPDYRSFANKANIGNTMDEEERKRRQEWRNWRKNQCGETIVCLKRPKVFSHAVDNIEPHYYATRMIDVCEMFERRDGV